MFDPHSEVNRVVIGGGCFWCIEAIFQETRGITRVESGYSGGTISNPTYEQVCSKTTRHVEVCLIEFDIYVISLRTILTQFLSIHDPTSIDRQGNDVGPQYASVIFYEDDAQKETALKLIQELESQNVFKNKIVTRVDPLINYYPAEDYHQNFFKSNPNHPYCQIVINPKMEKFRSGLQ